MSYSNNFYIGPFLKVMNPDILTPEIKIVRGCLNPECFDCKDLHQQTKNYCSVCGSEIKEFEQSVTTTKHIDVFNTCLRLFKNGDMFCGHIPEIDGCRIIIANCSNFPHMTDNSVDENSIVSFKEFSAFNFDNKQWQILIDELLAQGFQLEKDIGIIHYVY